MYTLQFYRDVLWPPDLVPAQTRTEPRLLDGRAAARRSGGLLRPHRRPRLEQVRHVLADPALGAGEVPVLALPAAELRGVEEALAATDLGGHDGVEHLVVDHRLDHVARHLRMVEHAVEADQAVLVGVAAELEAGAPAAAAARVDGRLPPGDAGRQPPLEIALVELREDVAQVEAGAHGLEDQLADAGGLAMAGEVL